MIAAIIVALVVGLGGIFLLEAGINYFIVLACMCFVVSLVMTVIYAYQEVIKKLNELK